MERMMGSSMGSSRQWSVRDCEDEKDGSPSDRAHSRAVSAPVFPVRDPEVAPILAQVKEEESHTRADQLVEAVREQCLGVIGLEETRHALEHGQGEVLVMAEEARLSEQERNDLVRLATLAGTEVDLVKGHERLQHMGGVGALLRYRAR
jgi:stalled ribosome rescue protein Dom34